MLTMRRLLACLFLLVALFACKAGDSRWPESTPEEQGVDSAPLLEMLTEIECDDLPVHGLVVIRHGHLIFEAYPGPYRSEDRHIMYSATKSVSAMLIGLAIADEYIDADTQLVFDLLPEYRRRVGPLDEAKKSLQLRHILTMTAGFEWQDGPYGIREPGDFSRVLAASDGVKYILSKPVVAAPGSGHAYNSGCSHLLSAIIQNVTEMPSLDYARQSLFEPIGVRNAAWSAYQGISNGASELFLRPRDMARLGHLILRRGQWDGEVVVPEVWISKLVEPIIRTDFLEPHELYGYGWYTKTIAGHQVHSAEGLGGNGIYVVPDLDLVVVFTGGLTGREMLAPYRFLKEFLLPAVRSSLSLSAKPDLVRQLKKAATGSPDPGPGHTPQLPSTATAISGRVFRTGSRSNLLGIKELSFDFSVPSSGRLEVVAEGAGNDDDWGIDPIFRSDEPWGEERRLSLKIGLDGNFRTVLIDHAEIGRTPISARGRWDGETRLLLTLVSAWALPETWTFDLTDANAATLTIEHPFYQTTISATATGDQ